MFDDRRNDNPRELLAAIRQGDYAHPGEEAAIDMVLRELDKLPLRASGKEITMLDVGCGSGGTAAYIQNKKKCSIVGIDIDEVAIQSAKNKYPSVSFLKGDVLNLNQYIHDVKFDVAYSFNVLYHFEDKVDILTKLASVCRSKGFLIISDYCINHEKEFFTLRDLVSNPIYPFHMSKINETLKAAGWEMLACLDISNHYLEWYKSFLTQLNKVKLEILSSYSVRAYEVVETLFSKMVEDIEEKLLGGCILIAVKRD